jgi:hypothetical protein
MEVQTLPISPSSQSKTISSGKYVFPEISGDITVVIDPKEEVYLTGQVNGKGKLSITGGRIQINTYSGDVEVTLSNCWIVAPFVNQASSLTIKDCTLFYDPKETFYFIHNRGLKLTIEQSKFIFSGLLYNDLTVIKNDGELINCFRTNFYLHFGHEKQDKELYFVESNRGEVEMLESCLLLTSMFCEKPILVKGSGSIVKLKKFGLSSNQEFLSTMVEDCQVFFEECFFNGKPVKELMDKQEVIGDYSSHMAGKIYIIYAKHVLVDTSKAPVYLQLPLHARHNETILVQKRFPSPFAVKIKVCKEKKEFIIGQGGVKSICYVLLRFSSKGWVEKERGEGEYKEKKNFEPDVSMTQEQNFRRDLKRNKSLTLRSKDIRTKFNRGRELRKDLLKK